MQLCRPVSYNRKIIYMVQFPGLLEALSLVSEKSFMMLRVCLTLMSTGVSGLCWHAAEQAGREKIEAVP